MKPIEKVRIKKVESLSMGVVKDTIYIVEYTREKTIFQKVLYKLFGIEDWVGAEQIYSENEYEDESYNWYGLVFNTLEQATAHANRIKGLRILDGYRATII
jgi:hypothetical protein